MDLSHATPRAASSGPQLVPDAVTLAAGLAEVLGTNGCGVPKILARRSNPQGTFPQEVVACRLADGRNLLVLCKYGVGHTTSGHGHRGGVPHEATVYRRVLNASALPLPRFYGSYVNPATGDEWLIVEYLRRSQRLSSASDVVSAMTSASRWIGEFHRACENGSRDPAWTSILHRHDRRYYAGWASRTLRVVDQIDSRETWLYRLAAAYRDHVDVLLESPTVIHGEFCPKNILLRRELVYPVDWESAAFGAGVIDLAMLTDLWDSETVQACERTYCSARWPEGVPADFETKLDLARLYVHFRWLGGESASEAYSSSRLESLRAVGDCLGFV